VGGVSGLRLGAEDADGCCHVGILARSTGLVNENFPNYILDTTGRQG
jgi:hypothetical protein